MSKRRAKKARAATDATPIPDRDVLADRIERLTLGLITALMIVAVLIPTDSIPHVGNCVVIVMLWMVAACVFLTACVVRGSFHKRLGPTSIAAASLLIFHVVSLLVMIGYGEGNARAGINMTWRWTSCLVAFLLVRHLVRNHLQCRALCAVMIALAVGVSSLGLFQYFYVNPVRMSEFKQLKSEEDVREWLTKGGLPFYEPRTPERRHLEDRINALEPVGTFALTNSLGAFIAAWLTLAIAIALMSWSAPELRHRMTATAVFVGMFVGLCLLLTKSRTSWLALAVGIIGLAVYFWCYGLRWSWKLPAAVATAVITLAAIAVAVGGIDKEVVSETFKSFSYRLEYWQATWAMIRDQPWLGCGPGNFKECYTQYKLPQASESVGDPHNCVLEIWSTAGSFAVLAFAAMVGCALIEIYRTRNEIGASRDSKKHLIAGEKKQAIPIYVGAIVGVFLAMPVGWIAGGVPSLAVIAVGVPAGIGSLILFHPWVERGRLSPNVLVICMGVLFVNLLAAGGISYLGVALSWWLMLAVALNLVESTDSKRVGGRRAAVVLLLLAAAAMFVCQRTTLLPVLQVRNLILDGDAFQASGDLLDAEDTFAKAARSDPFSPDPWARLVNVALQQWFASEARSTETFKRFEDYVDQLRRRDPKSHITYLFIGNRYLQAYASTKDEQLLQSAISSYQDAVSRYPNGNFQHAQLAWARHLAGDLSAARESADEARRLDALNPHEEKQLRNRFIFNGTSENGPENAEQMMEKIRTATSR